jgi:hypothetical protein
VNALVEGALMRSIVLGPIWLPSQPLNEGIFCDWIAQASGGDRIQYHEGHLLVDRSESFSMLPKAQRQALDLLARRAWIAMELGLAHLMSHRHAINHYQYIAVRSVQSVRDPGLVIRVREAEPRTPLESIH